MNIKNFQIHFWLICIFFFFKAENSLQAQQSSPDSSGTIFINLSGFKNNDGHLLASLFQGKDGFPGEYQEAMKISNYEIESDTVRLEFRDVFFGEYALSFLHDENNNRKLDSNWLGIPKEGIAVSNNVKGRFGPPKYEDAKFMLGSDSLFLEIKLNYF